MFAQSRQQDSTTQPPSAAASYSFQTEAAAQVTGSLGAAAAGRSPYNTVCSAITL